MIAVLIVGAATAGRVDPRSYGVWGVAGFFLLAAAFASAASGTCPTTSARNSSSWALLARLSTASNQ